MTDIELNPADLSKAGKGTLGTLGQQLASGGQTLEQSGQSLVNSASADESGFGAVITKAFGKGTEITGKMFKEGGGWLERAGNNLHQTGENHRKNDEEQASALRGIKDDGKVPTPKGGGSGGTGGLSDERPVDVVIPKGATPTQIQQFKNYVAGANRAVAANALSRTGRVASTKNGVRNDATKAAKRERDRAAAANKPYQGVAGHVPDAAWMGQGEPHEWQDMDKQVNSSLAGQINRYPVGYQPTVFRIVHPSTDEE